MSLTRVAIIGLVLQFVGVLTAVYLYGNYDFNQNLSSLGARAAVVSLATGEHIPRSPHPEIFNTTVIITGILLLSIPILLYQEYYSEELGDFYNLWVLLQVSFSFVAFAALTVLGFLDVGTVYVPHYIATVLFFMFILFTFLFNFIWSIIYRSNWQNLKGLYTTTLLLVTAELLFSIGRILSLNSIGIRYFYIDNGLYQKVWGVLYMLIWFTQLALMWKKSN